MLEQVTRWSASYLGVCGKCMRQSFLAAFFAMLLATAVSLWVPWSQVAWAIDLVAVSLVLLWIMHLVAYAWRAAGHPGTAGGGAPDVSRRALVPAFARMFAAAALITALPEVASAAGCCNCTLCRAGQVCCRTANGCCGCFPAGIKC